MPNNEWFRALLEAARLALVIAITYRIAPCVTAAHPDLKPWVVELGIAFISALALFFIQLLIFPKAHVRLEWTRHMDTHPLSEVDANIDGSNNSGNDLFWVRVRPDRAYGIGWLALHLGVRFGKMHVQTGAHHSSLALLVEGPLDPRKVRARSHSEICGVQLKLDLPVPENDVWQFALVRFAGTRARPAEPAELRHSASGDNWFGKACGLLVTVDSDAQRVVERWS